MKRHSNFEETLLPTTGVDDTLMSVIEEIRNHFGEAEIARCVERGCRLRLDGLREHVILKGERICPNQKISDCIIFVQEASIVVGIIELKSKTIHATDVTQKLTNGLQAAWDILHGFNNRVRTHVFLVVLAKGWDTSAFRKLKREPGVQFQGKEYSIRPKRCGASFKQIISSL